MQTKDKELDSILQEARESYKRRIDELKHSLKSISENSQEKEFKSEIEKFSPFKTQLEESESLGYSASFKPVSGLYNEEVKFHPRSANSEDVTNNKRFSNSKLEDELEINSELNEEVKNLRMQIGNLEDSLERCRQNYQELENINNDLRIRLKDATLHINKLTEEISKSREIKNDSTFKEIHNMKLHYKKKVSKMKEELLSRDSDKNAIANELSVYKQREKDLMRVCESQIKEICDEYSKNMRSAGTIHNEELSKVKNDYEAISQTQNNKFMEEINNLRNQIKEYDRALKSYKEKGEALLAFKEQSEKIIQEKNDLLREKESAYKKMRLEYELEIKQAHEENNLRLSQITKMSEEINKQNSYQVKLKLELEVQLESEKIKTANLENKFSRIEAAYSELHNNYQNLVHKIQILESQLFQQPQEFKKKYDIEVNRYHEKIKTLENELKSLYLANSGQAKEMEALKKLCAEIEVKQEDNSKELCIKHEENMREIKRLDRFEYLQLSDAFEAAKENLKQSEQTIEELESRIDDSHRKESEMLTNIKRLEGDCRESNDIINKLKNQLRSQNLKQQKVNAWIITIKDGAKAKIHRFREIYKGLLKAIQEEVAEFKNLQQRCMGALLKNTQISIETLQKNQSGQFYKYHQENLLISNDLRNAHERIELLEINNQKNHTTLRKLEEENINLNKVIESRDPEKLKSYYESFLRQLMSQISFLEQGVEESYAELSFNVKDIKECCCKESESKMKETDLKMRENEEKIRENEAALNSAKKSIEYYRDRLMKIESEKALEVNRSKQELISLEQRLAQVLVDIREQRD